MTTFFTDFRNPRDAVEFAGQYPGYAIKLNTFSHPDGKRVGYDVTTKGKTFPCTDYYLERGKCKPAEQTRSIMYVLDGKWHPTSSYFNPHDSEFDPTTGKYISSYDMNMRKGKAYLYGEGHKGITGKGKAGYLACKNICDNDPNCLAFENVKPTGKSIDPNTGGLIDDPNADFACKVWRNVGNFEGAAVVARGGGQGFCWTKKCQNHLKHAYNPLVIQARPNEYGTENEYNTFGGPEGVADQDLNNYWRMNEPGKDFTDFLFGQATIAGNNTTRPPYCCGNQPGVYPITTFPKWTRIDPTPPPTAPPTAPPPPPSPVDCVQSNWTPCSKSCGGGTQSRTTLTYPANGGKACGPSSQTCNTQPCPIDCVQSPWGFCSKPCGGGTQTRTIWTQPAYGGKACGPSTQSCNTQSCPQPIDCVQSVWSSCSKPCGGGTQTRTIVRQPANGGKACGPSTQSCNTFKCQDCPKSTDLNNDGKVNLLDVADLQNQWGQCFDDSCTGDINCDYQVDLRDMNYLINDWTG